MSRPAAPPTPMHLLFLAPFGLQPKMTTSARALPLAQALAARGHRLTLLVPPWDDRARAGQVAEIEGVHVVHLPLPADSRLDMPLLVARMLAAARAARPDLLHAFKPKGPSGAVAAAWGALRRALAPGVPVVMDSDDWEGAGGWNERAGYPRWQRALFARQERWGLTRADAVTVASRALEGLVWSLGVPPARVAYLPNGPRHWPTPDPAAVAALRARLGLVGHPVALLYTRFFEFDPERLAAAWARVVAEMPAARLLVVGRGLAGEEAPFRHALTQAGVGGTVVEVGWLEPAELPTHWALATVGLYPMDDTLINRTKCPAKLTDLLGAGLPVVGERVGQIGEYIAPGAGGIAVETGDMAAFAAATVALLRDPAGAAALGAAGQARLHARFGWPTLAATAETLYATLHSRG